jgi:hypothetical protein
MFAADVVYSKPGPSSWMRRVHVSLMHGSSRIFLQDWNKLSSVTFLCSTYMHQMLQWTAVKKIEIFQYVGLILWKLSYITLSLLILGGLSWVGSLEYGKRKER